MRQSRTIAIDFDGTIVEHEFPAIGRPVDGAIETLKELQARGHKIILWTMRAGETLDAAIKFLSDNGITLYGVNVNPDQTWSRSPKAYAAIYIDDAALGCPLTFPGVAGKRPYVNWASAREWLKIEGVL